MEKLAKRIKSSLDNDLANEFDCFNVEVTESPEIGMLTKYYDIKIRFKVNGVNRGVTCCIREEEYDLLNRQNEYRRFVNGIEHKIENFKRECIEEGFSEWKRKVF
ncbi:MAG: hypothetical protein ACRCX8_06785 [Sarcina sp.]